MNTLSYWIEFKKRFVRCLVAYLIVFAPLLYYSASLYTFLAKPLLRTLPKGSTLIATHITTPFTVPLKLALFTALVIIIPWVLYQIWAFIAPALYAREKKRVFPLVIGSVGLFYIGILFAHSVVLPMALGFFYHIAPNGVSVMTDITHYMDFMLSLYFAFGIAFEVPIIILLCIRLGFIFAEDLARHLRYIILAAFVIGMLLTPPDVVSQILLAIPLLLLFEGGLWLAKRL